ncbi:helix-turn-helix transcriptional regulator [Acinetobacter kyonggiensis]|uniref:Predicted DNA-binding transcriptional regulator AlpA n=1 Tax=Acinetobacter kyonggiensis TaxID=595670 RepID=A0A1H3LWP4_9GAMM|nr:AlpA family transcriptional regulator [Acinetobacter kyonggiensis]SDY68753.1 Predicted DNA-binding transcriptional regulator AlpA [Acinetobacter kyonggiensis]
MLLSKKQQIGNVRLIRRKEVQDKTGLGASSIYAMMAQGKFPKAVNISKRRVAWIESDIDFWIAECIAHNKQAVKRYGKKVSHNIDEIVDSLQLKLF